MSFITMYEHFDPKIDFLDGKHNASALKLFFTDNRITSDSYYKKLLSPRDQETEAKYCTLTRESLLFSLSIDRENDSQRDSNITITGDTADSDADQN